MRFAYLDESGIGDATKEPYIVVAGVIVHADLQIKAIEKYLADMVADFIPPTLRIGFCFHAKEIFNGNGIFDRNAYPKETRWQVLQELCEIPKKFDLPVVMGCLERAELAAKIPAANTNSLVANAQAIASTACLFAIERYMRQGERSREVASVIYENNDHSKTLIRNTQRFLRSGEFTDTVGAELFPTWSHLLPFERIVEAPLFADKNESAILQIADAVAFALNRKLRNAIECDRFFAPLDQQLIIRAKMFDADKHKGAE